MTFATERTVEVEFRGSTYRVQLVMPTMRQKRACVGDDGHFSTDKYFELCVKSIEGEEINGKAIKTGADILDSSGTDELFLAIFREVNKWDMSEDESKN
jgi:hypothetical protein